MTRDEWIKRYVCRMKELGSVQTEEQLITTAENGCNATEATGRLNPDSWETPEVIAEEHIENE